MKYVVPIIALLLALTATAGAQPYPPGYRGPPLPPGTSWSQNGGWQVNGLDDFDQRVAASRAAHDERVRKMNEDFEASKKRMDDDFNRTSRYMLGGFALFTLVIIIGGISQSSRRRRRAATWNAQADYEYAPAALAPDRYDVSVIRVAIDGRASKFVQTELAAIAKTYDGTTADSRARRLRETSIMLRRVRDSWIYGGADNDPLRPRDEALAAVVQHVDEARSRVKQQSTPLPSPSQPPVGVILVSIVVAARGELMTITDLATGEDIRRALEAAVDRAANDLVAVEIVWAPAETGAQLSSLDLEAAYRKSELHPLEGARVGKAFCTYCGGPFPMELVTCPHCGAPAREARAS